MSLTPAQQRELITDAVDERDELRDHAQWTDENYEAYMERLLAEEREADERAHAEQLQVRRELTQRGA